MVAVSAQEGQRVRLWVRGILAVDGAPGVLQEAIHLSQAGRGRAIRPGEEGDRGGIGFVLEPAIHGPLIRGPGLLGPLAPLPDAVLVLRRERRSDPARQRCADAAQGGQRGRPVGRAPGLKVRMLRAERAELAQAASEGCLVRRALQPAQDLPEGTLGRLDAHQRAGQGPPPVASLLWAEAHLP